MIKLVISLAVCGILTGCAAVAPLSSLITSPSGGPPPLQVHEQTEVRLAKDNFVLVKTNVVGRTRGFSLLGLITIVPASLGKAMNRLYAAAEMHPGRPQTIANLIIEQTSTYWILFGIPQVHVRADIVEFRPTAKAHASGPPPPELPPPKPPETNR